MQVDWIVTDRETGEAQIVKAPEGKTPKDCGYSTKAHRWRRAGREPGEHDDIVNGRLVVNEDRKRQAAERRRSLEERIDARLRHWGLIPEEADGR